MNSITYVLLDLATKGCPIKVNFKTKTIKVKRKILYEHGEIKRDKIIWGDDEYKDLKDRPLISIDEEKDIDTLYEQFKYSVPCKFDMNKKENFYCLPVDKMTHKQMVNGLERGIARVWLECYILFKRNELLNLFKDSKLFYWRSEKDKDLVILKEMLV